MCCFLQYSLPSAHFFSQHKCISGCFRGAAQEEYEEQVQELERLRWVHEASQVQHITALAWQAKQEAMLHVLKAATARATPIQVGQELISTMM